ncbi:phosphatase [Streptomyces sp. TRM 70351]|uniref:phosphatase n=1 Tax=Streptomyces sp. TRM 70351 TaxID=3116552 RepID=UPI002E7B27AF|nr:phosphatase [Streptomyces sp. TRM 70351]MEE1931478.1 phosphatase [Streptomyces sp. TRM 70351]
MLTTSVLRTHLLAAGLAGAVATTRERSLRRHRLFAARDPRALLGLEPEHPWSVPQLLALMAGACGACPDPGRRDGRETIDPALTVSALDAFADRLALAAARRAPVLFGTGHPRSLLPFYAGLAAALAAAGCPVLTPGYGRCIEVTTRFGVRPYTMSYVRGVALVREAGAACAPGAPGAHTHSPLPVRVALAAAAGAGGPLPALVIGDHGWLCGAGQLGFDAMGPADADDPAAFVGQAEGRVSLAVPLDDALRPGAYRMLTRYVLNRACLSQ